MSYQDTSNRIGSLSLIAQLSLFVFCPILSILGNEFYRSFHDSTFLSLLVALVCCIPILVALGKINQKLYPLALISISLTLLYFTSFSSLALVGADVHEEYYFANLVKINSSWNSTIPYDINGMLSIVMLAPIISIVSSIPLVWVFKAVYPLLFSFLPLILYRAFAYQLDRRISFFGVFFFISVFTFFTEMIGLCRQQIAEIFLGLILLLLIGSVRTDPRKRVALLFTFGGLLSLSHYTVAYFFISVTFFALIVIFLQKNRLIGRARVHGLRLRSHRAEKDDGESPFSFRATQIPKNARAVTAQFFVYCSIITVVWSIFVSGSSTFDRFVNTVRLLVTGALRDLLNPESTQGLYILISSKAELLHEIARVLHIVTILFVAVGVVYLTLRRTKEKFNDTYFAFSLVSFMVCVSAIILPYLASSVNTTRLYHITLIFLAPFCVIGVVIILEWISHLSLSMSKSNRRVISRRSALAIFSVFLSVFLMFNTGLVYQIAGNGTSLANPDWAIEKGNTRDRIVYYNARTSSEEVLSAVWLSEHRDSIRVYSDYRARNNALTAYAMIPRNEVELMLRATVIDAQSCVYLRRLNIVDNTIEGARRPTGNVDVLDAKILVHTLLNEANLIYGNGASEIFYTISAVPFNDTSS